jgi:hypothetical protein
MNMAGPSKRPNFLSGRGMRGAFAALSVFSATVPLLPQRADAQSAGQQGVTQGYADPRQFAGAVDAQDLGNGQGQAAFVAPDRRMDVTYSGNNIHRIAVYKNKNGPDYRFEDDLQRGGDHEYRFSRMVNQLASNIVSQNPSMQNLQPAQLGRIAETVLLDMMYMTVETNRVYDQVNMTNRFGRGRVNVVGIPHCAPADTTLNDIFGSGDPAPPQFADPDKNPALCNRWVYQGAIPSYRTQLFAPVYAAPPPAPPYSMLPGYGGQAPPADPRDYAPQPPPRYAPNNGPRPLAPQGWQR